MPAETPEAEEIYGKEEAQARILLDLLRTKHPKVLSEVSDEDIPILVGIGTIAEMLNSDLLRTARKEFLEFSVSKNRAGRQELVTIALAARYRGGGTKGGGLKELLAGIR